jgi:hypothetical protein
MHHFVTCSLHGQFPCTQHYTLDFTAVFFFAIGTVFLVIGTAFFVIGAIFFAIALLLLSLAASADAQKVN